MPKDPFDWKDKVTEDYPGFVVHDGRVTGSITLGHSRLPLWCFINIMIEVGYTTAAEDYPTLPTYATAAEIGSFLYDLLEQRREFARLCVLVDVERQEREARERDYGPNAVYDWGENPQAPEELKPALQQAGLGPTIRIDPGNLPPALQPWFRNSENRERVRAALHRCLEELDGFEAENSDHVPSR
jgi:hypothetical protein